MKLVLLCGGMGERMFPITEDKFLLKFLGNTLLEHQIELAKGAGLNEFIIIGNPQNIEKIEQIAANIHDVDIEVAIQPEPLGIANALESAEELLAGEIIVVNPNDVFDSSAYTKLIEQCKKGSAISYILGYLGIPPFMPFLRHDQADALIQMLAVVMVDEFGQTHLSMRACL